MQRVGLLFDLLRRRDELDHLFGHYDFVFSLLFGLILYKLDSVLIAAFEAILERLFILHALIIINIDVSETRQYYHATDLENEWHSRSVGCDWVLSAFATDNSFIFSYRLDILFKID
jgi:hypothetical protein